MYCDFHAHLHTKWYRALQGGTCYYMTVHKPILSWFMAVHVCTWQCTPIPVHVCTWQCTPASSHCMHKLVYLSLGTLARASPGSGPPLPAAAAAAAGDAAAGASPAVAASTGVTSRERTPAPPASDGPRPAGEQKEGRQHVVAKRRLR